MRLLSILVVGGLSGCRSPDNALEKKLEGAVGLFEYQFEHIKHSTEPGKPCYALIDGSLHYEVQEFGHVVAKEVRQFEERFDFVVVAFDPYKTTIGPRFDKLAHAFDEWKTGPYADAIKACQSCAEENKVRDPLAQNCTVP